MERIDRKLEQAAISACKSEESRNDNG